MLDSANCFDFDQAGNMVVKAIGGLITLVNKISASLTNCCFEVITPGRITRLAISAGGKVSVTFNIHDEKLAPAQFLCLENRILDDTASAKANPHQFSVSLVGDINVPPPGSDKREIDSPAAGPTSVGPSAAEPAELHSHRPFYHRWAYIF